MQGGGILSSVLGKICLALVLLAAIPTSINAQMLRLDQDPAQAYHHGVELISKQKYANAQSEFDQAMKDLPEKTSVLWENSRYYAAVCALELFNEDGESRMLSFVEAHPEHPKVEMANFYLGRYYFTKKRYTRSLDYLELVDPHELDPKLLDEYYFKKGYGEFQREKYDLAKESFDHIANAENRYQSPAKYYTSYIFYREGAYETALVGFRSLESDNLFGPVVPYYICQILFLQDKYEEVITYGTELLEVAADSKRGEVSRMLGQSYFELGKYAEAIPHLQTAMSDLGGSDEHRYQLGYAHYQVGNCDEANVMFEPVTMLKTELAQLSFYHMADCYLKAGDKRSSRKAFREASKMKFNEQIHEDALFNFAKLSYELSLDPYHEAIEAFEAYIARHPNSRRVDEAYSFLLQVYLTTKNYQQALKSLDRIKDKNDTLKRTYQKVAYLRGVEVFNDLDFRGAVISFRKVYKYPVDAYLSAQAKFWEAEAYARLGKWEAAESNYLKFVEMPGSISLHEFQLAHYGLGYVAFEQQDYPIAIEWFRKFGTMAKNEDKRLTDAWLRTGDSYYLSKQSERAIDFYDKAIKLGVFDMDYAIFQISVCYGLQGKTASKVESLKAMLDNYPKTDFAADAKYEIGETYFFTDNTSEAKKYFNMVLTDHPHSSYVAKAKLNLGLIAYNNSDDATAMPILKEVAENYSATQEGKEALFKVQKMYTEQGDVPGFEKYLSENSFPDLTQGALDTSYYEAAEIRLKNGQYGEAMTEFEKYLAKFPNGFFVLNANFYYAESAVEMGRNSEALKGYNEVLKFQKNTFTEKAIITAARIYFDQQNYNEALLRFIMLEEVAEVAENLQTARVGLMRCHYKLNNFVESEKYCGLLVKALNTPLELKLEASITQANCALGQNKLDVAMGHFKKTSEMSSNHIAAESMYQIARIYHLQGKYLECEAAIYDLLNKLPGYQVWVSKAFLLMADNYLAQGDKFQARLTLQNIVDNYSDPEVKADAQRRLLKLEKTIQEESKPEPREDLMIEFESERKGEGQLFELDSVAPELEIE